MHAPTRPIQDEIIPLVEEGVKGFKCFMIHSGVDEFPHVSEMDLNIALQKIKETEAVLMVSNHAGIWYLVSHWGCLLENLEKECSN